MEKFKKPSKEVLIDTLIDAEIKIINSRISGKRDYSISEMLDFLETLKLNNKVIYPRKGKGGPIPGNSEFQGFYKQAERQFGVKMSFDEDLGYCLDNEFPDSCIYEIESFRKFKASR